MDVTTKVRDLSRDDPK